MNERKPWICPACGRGVAPYKDTCDHGGQATPQITFVPVFVPAPSWPTSPTIGCDACRQSGVCNCYRPNRLTPTYGDTTGLTTVGVH